MRKVLYQGLPAIYKNSDDEKAYLKRFYNVLGEALNLAQGDIERLFYLYDVRRQDEDILNVLAENMGFKFPANFTLDEKRLFIHNFPRILKIKGEDGMYELLAHIFFHEDARVSVEWEYNDEDGYSTRNIVMGLDVPDTIGDFDVKREKFENLVDYFRIINVGIAWNVILFYMYVIKMKVTYKTFDLIEMEDNFESNIGEEEEPELLNEGDIPFHLSGPRGFPPEAGFMSIISRLFDDLNEKEEKQELTSTVSYRYSNELGFQTEEEDVKITSSYVETDAMDEFILEFIDSITGRSEEFDSIFGLIREDNKSSVEYFDSQEILEETDDEVTSLVTYAHKDFIEKDDVLLNKGTLNSTLILNGERQEI